jgi:hypothetical protein
MRRTYPHAVRSVSYTSDSPSHRQERLRRVGITSTLSEASHTRWTRPHAILNVSDTLDSPSRSQEPLDVFDSWLVLLSSGERPTSSHTVWSVSGALTRPHPSVQQPRGIALCLERPRCLSIWHVPDAFDLSLHCEVSQTHWTCLNTVPDVINLPSRCLESPRRISIDPATFRSSKTCLTRSHAIWSWSGVSQTCLACARNVWHALDMFGILSRYLEREVIVLKNLRRLISCSSSSTSGTQTWTV